MVSGDFLDSREIHEISQENSPSQETHLPNLTRLDVLAQVATNKLDLRLGFEPDLGVDHFHDFLRKQTENKRDSHGDDEARDGFFLFGVFVSARNRDSRGDAAETSAAGERRGISGVEVMSEAERREELERQFRMEHFMRIQREMYETAKRFARKLHSDMPEDLEYHQDKKQRIEEDGKKKVGDLGGPFKDAIQMIKKRSSLNPDAATMRFCVGENRFNVRTQVAPSLLELSLRQLGKHAEALVSLQCIPDGLRSKIAGVVSRLGKVNFRFMKLLVEDSPAVIRVKNCTNLEEKDLIRILRDCDTEMLRVLKLDLCGRAMKENVINGFLSRSPKGLPALTNLSLKGAFGLTDSALALISRSAPQLQWLNLSDCSLLSDVAVQILADNFGSTLKGLNIEGCQGINPSHILGNLKRFKSLSKLSIAGLENIDDDFVVGFLEARGSSLTKLVLANCMKVSDGSIKAIGRYCPKLRVLDVSFLNKLTDMSLQYIANGCRSLSTLRCCRNHFSDEGIAAFLEVSGGSLSVLSLNNIRKVGLNTVISLAKVSKKLHSLDLSWCRNLTDEDLRLILHSCPSLRQIKLFGCSQVTEELLRKPLGSSVQIIGLRMASLLKHLTDIGPVSQEASVSE